MGVLQNFAATKRSNGKAHRDTVDCTVSWGQSGCPGVMKKARAVVLTPRKDRRSGRRSVTWVDSPKSAQPAVWMSSSVTRRQAGYAPQLTSQPVG